MKLRLPTRSSSATRTSTSRQDDSNQSPSSSRPDSARDYKPLLAILKRDEHGNARDQGFFGSIRFPSTPAAPAKFVRLASSHNFADPEESALYARHVVNLALTTWKLPPPCAVISIPEAGVSASKLSVNSRLDLVLRRGIAEAAHRTGAWIFTGGSSSDAAARAAGRAMLNVANEHGDSERLPVIGVLPWAAVQCHEMLATLPNGYCWQYDRARDITKADTLSELAAHHMEPINIDTHHSHFFMVDDKLITAELLRGTIEKYISDTDISKDSIQTPKVVLLIAGDAAAFKHIRDQLDPSDPQTGTAVPVLVLADSGGAAEDIHRYHETGEFPTIDEHRDEAYIAEAKAHLPEIKRLGELTGQNSRAQLAFFRLSDDLDGRDDLALEIQRAMLNDCPNVKEEALLAIKWKEPAVLKQHLHESASLVLSNSKMNLSEQGEQANDKVDVLQVALTRPGGADISVVRTILDYVSEPMVRMDDLFHKSFDRYPVAETKGMWTGSRRKKKKLMRSSTCTMQLIGRSATATNLFSESSLRPSVKLGSNGSPDGSPPAARERTTTQRRSLFRSDTGALDDELSSWESATNVLSAVVDGYAFHLEARRAAGQMSPNWTDLMMWAVLSGQHDLAEALWEKTSSPIRSALMAGQLCLRLEKDQALAADGPELRARATRYEELALDLLDAIRQSPAAVPLISLIPWVYVDAQRLGEVQRRPLWRTSAIEMSAEDDGMLSVPCLHFLAHRHAQVLFDKYFSGNYPGSSACIHPSASFVSIAIQACLPFLPGTVVEVSASEEGTNVARSGASVAEDYKREEGSGGLAIDPDLVEAVEEFMGGLAEKKAETGLADLLDDLLSLRFLYFYSVPKVKFTLHLVQHLLFMLLLTVLLLVVYEEDFISSFEIFFWLWTLMRTLGELTEIDSFTRRGLWMYIRDPWNQMDVATFVLVVAIVGVRVYAVGLFGDASPSALATSRSMLDTEAVYDPAQIVPIFPPLEVYEAMARNLYAILVTLVYVRVLQYLRVFKSIGVFSIVLAGIFQDVKMFAIVQMVLMASFGVAFATLQPGVMGAYESYDILGSAPLYVPFWGLFGEVDLLRMLRQINNELPTQVLLPVLLWIYLFLACIILVNLLIAQITNTYSRIMDKSLSHWQLERCRLVDEFKDSKPPAPPPFNVLYHTITIGKQLLFTADSQVDVYGFKTLPSSPQLASLQKAEGQALQRCLQARAARASQELSSRVEVSVREIRKLEDQNRGRFENLNGRIDQIMSGQEMLKGRIDDIAPPGTIGALFQSRGDQLKQ